MRKGKEKKKKANESFYRRSLTCIRSSERHIGADRDTKMSAMIMNAAVVCVPRAAANTSSSRPSGTKTPVEMRRVRKEKKKIAGPKQSP